MAGEESQIKIDPSSRQIGTQDDAGLPNFVLHSYTGSPEVAKKFVELGAYISFNGIIATIYEFNSNV